MNINNEQFAPWMKNKIVLTTEMNDRKKTKKKNQNKNRNRSFMTKYKMQKNRILFLQSRIEYSH